MHTLESVIAPEVLTLPFDRLDAGDVTELRDIDILLDLPEIVSVARVHFRNGTGYEVIVSESADQHDLSDVIALVGHLHMVRAEPWGLSANGEARRRLLYWEHSVKPIEPVHMPVKRHAAPSRLATIVPASLAKYVPQQRYIVAASTVAIATLDYLDVLSPFINII